MKRRIKGVAPGRFAALWLLASVALSLTVADQAAAKAYPIAVLRALDKVTARVTTLEAPVNQSVFFGDLEIVARRCDKRPPEEVPESAAFLEIYETVDGDTIVNVFSGWMFASSPGLSAMEHRVYEVWVIDCRSNAATSPFDSPSPAPR